MTSAVTCRWSHHARFNQYFAELGRFESMIVESVPWSDRLQSYGCSQASPVARRLFGLNGVNKGSADFYGALIRVKYVATMPCCLGAPRTSRPHNKWNRASRSAILRYCPKTRSLEAIGFICWITVGRGFNQPECIESPYELHKAECVAHSP
jgi:hypothetical protein